MSTPIRQAAIQLQKITPARTFFRVSEKIPSVAHAREIFKVLGNYGELVEYKVLRCPETLQYLRYGFVVYKNSDDANKAINDQFIKHQSDLYEKPIDIKVERSVISKPKWDNVEY